jgi:hypothetical protein
VILSDNHGIMAVSEAIESLRSKIRQNLIEQDVGENPDERWLAPPDLATKTFRPQLLDLLNLLAGNNIAARERECLINYCKVLLVLIESGCTCEDLQRFKARALEDDGIRDRHLPVQRARAIDQYGEDLGKSFHRNQFMFCPVILRDGEEKTYLGEMDQHCPLPFESREKLGGGSSGAVYKVKVILAIFIPRKMEWAQTTRYVLPRLTQLLLLLTFT